MLRCWALALRCGKFVNCCELVRWWLYNVCSQCPCSGVWHLVFLTRHNYDLCFTCFKFLTSFRSPPTLFGLLPLCQLLDILPASGHNNNFVNLLYFQIEDWGSVDPLLVIFLWFSQYVCSGTVVDFESRTKRSLRDDFDPNWCSFQMGWSDFADAENYSVWAQTQDQKNIVFKVCSQT